MREPMSARSPFADTSAPPPSDAFERGFRKRAAYRDADMPGSQSRPWLLWFLVIALSGGIAATVFWSDRSISRDGAPQIVGSDSAWRGMIRQPRPDRSLVPKPLEAQARTKLAAYSGSESTRSESTAGTNPSVRAGSSAQSSPDLLGDPTILSIQGLLNKNGFNPGPVDGLMGKRTQTAILAWQLQRGLPTTGKPGKQVLEQLLDPAKAGRQATRLPIGVLSQAERDTFEAWCGSGRKATNPVSYYECMGDEVAKLKNGLRWPKLSSEAFGNFDSFETARLLCTDQSTVAPQIFFECLHTKLGKNKSLLVME